MPDYVQTLEKYLEGVESGSVVAGSWVKKAAERFQSFRTGKVQGVTFDLERVKLVFDFFSLLQHTKGKAAGSSFTLEPWQLLIIAHIFGMVNDSGLRVTRTAYVSMARKNGKSSLAAGIALYLLVADGEGGAEVYSAATKRDQARIVYEQAQAMVSVSPSLSRAIESRRTSLSVPSTFSTFKALASDSNKLDGLNPSGLILDELHSWADRGLWDVLATATGSRSQPLTFAITTAGFDRQSICWEQEDYSRKVLDGVIDDPSWFAFVATLDEGDEWSNPSVWQKANPNLGITVSPDYLQTQTSQALESPGRIQAFRRLHANSWTESVTQFLDLEKWDAGNLPIDYEELEGMPCYAGLDLASTTDITAFVLLFDLADKFVLMPFFFVPLGNAQEREKKDRIPYLQWIESGFIEGTEGTVCDFEAVRSRINTLSEMYNIKEIAVDRWNATQLVVQLDGDGHNVTFFGQGYRSMNVPTKALEASVLGEKIVHGGNPVLRWMASNLCIEQDPAGNYKPSKRKSTEKIDGMVALIMAMGRHQASDDNDDDGSVYEDRGLYVL